jgi:hypothetical protein
MNAQQIVNEISAHVGTENRAGWYAGIATDARNCLFNRHKVDEKTGGWIYRTADNNLIARSAEGALHTGGFDGGPGGGDAQTIRVYAYRKTSSTSED